MFSFGDQDLATGQKPDPAQKPAASLKPASVEKPAPQQKKSPDQKPASALKSVPAAHQGTASKSLLDDRNLSENFDQKLSFHDKSVALKLAPDPRNRINPLNLFFFGAAPTRLACRASSAEGSAFRSLGGSFTGKPYTSHLALRRRPSTATWHLVVALKR